MNTRPQPRVTARGVALGATTAALLVLTACSGGPRTADVLGDGADFTTPAWAKPITTPGSKLTTIELGDISIDVFQADTAKAPNAGRYFGPVTKDFDIRAGDQVVFFNFVATNHGAPVDMDYSLIRVQGLYDDATSILSDFIEDPDFCADHHVNFGGVDGPFQDTKPYTLGTGETYSEGWNIKYQPKKEITFKATYYPVNSAGEIRVLESVEATASAITL